MTEGFGSDESELEFAEFEAGIHFSFKRSSSACLNSEGFILDIGIVFGCGCIGTKQGEIFIGQ